MGDWVFEGNRRIVRVGLLVDTWEGVVFAP